MNATANDMVVVADVTEESVLDALMDKVDEYFAKEANADKKKRRK